MSSTRQHTSSLAEILDRVLDKDIVIDLWVRVSLVGIEILTIEARVVIASVNTLPHYGREISKIEVAEKEGNLDEIEIEAFA